MSPRQDELPDHEPSTARPLKVLVVDDDLDSVTTLSLLLGYDGCDVRVAVDGSAALELVDAFHPEAIILDINLPGIDGFEIARRLRRNPSTRRVQPAPRQPPAQGSCR